MTEAATLRQLADEYYRTATARAEQASMADRIAERVSPTLAQAHREQAARHRREVEHHETRAKACLAGAAALDAAAPSTEPRVSP